MAYPQKKDVSFNLIDVLLYCIIKNKMSINAKNAFNWCYGKLAISFCLRVNYALVATPKIKQFKKCIAYDSGFLKQ